MRVKVLFFGMLKDVVGRAEEPLELPESGTLADIFNRYAAQFPRIREMAGSIVLAKNQEFSEPGAPVHDGDEIAFLPPVSGGADDCGLVREIAENSNLYALTRHAIDTKQVIDR